MTAHAHDWQAEPAPEDYRRRCWCGARGAVYLGVVTERTFPDEQQPAATPRSKKR